MALKTSFSLSELTFPMITAIARKRRYLTVSVISWITIVFLIIVFLLPQAQMIFSSLQEINTEEEKFEALKTQVEGLRTVDQAKIKEDLRILSETLPVEKPVLPVLSSLESIALETQVGISNFQINPGSIATESAKINTTESVLKGVLALPFQLEATGSFNSINTFFRKLDEQIPLINITSIEFSSSGGAQGASASGTPNFRAIVQIESLYIGQESKPKAGVAGTSTPVRNLTQKDEELLASISAMIANFKRFDVSSTPASASGRRDIFSL